MSVRKPVPEENIRQIIEELVRTRRGGDKPEEHEKEQGKCLNDNRERALQSFRRHGIAAK